jgi:hypothetical protein
VPLTVEPPAGLVTKTRTLDGSSFATKASPLPPPYVACDGRTVGYVGENAVPVTYAVPVALAATSPM